MPMLMSPIAFQSDLCNAAHESNAWGWVHKDWEGLLRDLVERLQADNKLEFGDFREISRAFHIALAQAAAPALNSALREFPQRSLSERRELATWCNQQLRDLHLAIQCPRTQRPCVLVADTRGADDRTSYFRLQARDGSGVVSRTVSFRQLPDLVLMDDPASRKGYSRER